jgi:hypothetical protein
MNGIIHSNLHAEQIEAFKQNKKVILFNFQVNPFKTIHITTSTPPYIIPVSVPRIDKVVLDNIKNIAKQLMNNTGRIHRITVDGSPAGFNHTIFFKGNPNDWVLEVKDDFTCENYEEYKKYWLENHLTKYDVFPNIYKQENTKMEVENLEIFSNSKIKQKKEKNGNEYSNG